MQSAIANGRSSADSRTMQQPYDDNASDDATFEVLLLGTDVDAMTENGTPAVLHVSLVGGDRVAQYGTSSNELLNKLLVGAFGSSLHVSHGTMLQQWLRQTRETAAGARHCDAVGLRVFQLEHSKVCIMGLLPSTGAAAPPRHDDAPLLLVLIVAFRIVRCFPIECLYEAVRSLLMEVTHHTDAELASQLAASSPRRGAADGIGGGGGVAQTTSLHNVLRTSTNATQWVSRNAYRFMDTVVQVVRALEHVALTSLGSAASDSTTVAVRWWSMLHTLLAIHQGPCADDAAEDEDGSSSQSIDSLVRACLTGAPLNGITGGRTYVVSDVVVWRGGAVVCGAQEDATALRGYVLNMAIGVTAQDELVPANRNDHSTSGTNNNSSGREFQPFVKHFAMPQRTDHGCGELPTGLYAAQPPPTAAVVGAQNIVVVGSRGTIVCAVVLHPHATLSSGAGALPAAMNGTVTTLPQSVAGMQEALRELSRASQSTGCAGNTQCGPPGVWPRVLPRLAAGASASSLVTTSIDMKHSGGATAVCPIAYEVHRYRATAGAETITSSSTFQTGSCVAAYIRGCALVGPLRYYCDEVALWFRDLEASAPHALAANRQRCVRRHIPLLDVHLHYAAGNPSGFAMATIAMETVVTEKATYAIALVLPSGSTAAEISRLLASLLASVLHRR